MNATPINEIDQRVILLPKETTYCEAYIAVSVRPDGNIVLGMDQQYSLYYQLCRLAALCEGGDLVMSGKTVKPEQYLKTWRDTFKNAKPLTDNSNADLLITAKLVVAPAQFEAENQKWRKKTLLELQVAHTGTPVGERIEFEFDLANPEQAKLLYENHHLHFDKDNFPVAVLFKENISSQKGTADLFAEVL